MKKRQQNKLVLHPHHPSLLISAPLRPAGIDAAVFSVASMFHPTETALDVFGDKSTSDARRRCQPGAGEDSTLFDLHLRVAIVYTFVYSGAMCALWYEQPTQGVRYFYQGEHPEEFTITYPDVQRKQKE